jgi:lipoprotein NlpI
VIALNNRGNVKRGKGDLDGALADYTRAIELFPQYSSAYRNRGIVKSAQRDFPRALADFRKATDLTPSDDYDRYYTWLTRARLGQRREATRDLANVRASRKVTQGDEWSLAIAEFLVGHLNEVEFLAAAQVSDPTTTKSQLCDAYFFSGAVRLLGQDKVGARELFQNSVATGDTTNAAYTSAVAELNGLR